MTRPILGDKIRFSKLKNEKMSFLPCLYCGVDSGPALQFFIWMIGGGLLAFLCFYGWGYFNGKFSNDESASQIPLDVERED